jgi:hypothetical protein
VQARLPAAATLPMAVMQPAAAILARQLPAAQQLTAIPAHQLAVAQQLPATLKQQLTAQQLPVVGSGAERLPLPAWSHGRAPVHVHAWVEPADVPQKSPLAPPARPARPCLRRNLKPWLHLAVEELCTC